MSAVRELPVNVAIIGAPVDLGAGRRGVDMGASAIRYAGLESALQSAGHSVRDFGNVPVPVAESTEREPADLKYLEPIRRMATTLADTVSATLTDGWFPLVLGGDHSMTLGSITGVTRQQRVGVLWLDAHGDFNVPSTSPSGNIHGMVLAALTGHGDDRLVCIDDRSPKVEARNVALIGTRQLDPGERALLQASDVHVFTMHDIDRLGLPRVVERALEQTSSGVDGIYLSLDLDVVDPIQAPGVGTPVLGGLSYRETHLAMELLAESGRLVAMDVVEVNPVLDTHNDTARLAMAFTLSALGQRIL